MRSWCRIRPDRRSSGPEHRINDRIRATQIRVIGAEGEQLGIMKVHEALAQARELGLDLVEVSPNTDPPVCKILDYGRMKYQESVRSKDARKKQSASTVKEVKFGPKIGVHDFDTKRANIEKFLSHGHRVKVIMFFRGRQMAHPELGSKVLAKLVEDIGDQATVETAAKLDGRSMTMVLAPVRQAAKAKAGGTNAENETE